jgi:hypothetical protein
MSRSGYSDDYDNYAVLMCYRGVVASATRGKRGQRFFRELVAALDVMPEKRLIAHDLENPEGVCALGALGKQKGVALPRLDPEDDYGENGDRLAPVFDIASQLANEVMYMNDDRSENDSPERRWKRMRDWAARQIIPTDAELGIGP